MLPARQQAASLTAPAKRVAQLHAEHALPLAGAMLQAAAQGAAALAAVMLSAQAPGLNAAQVLPIAAAALLAQQQALPATAADRAVPAANPPPQVAASDVRQRPFPSLIA